MDEGDGVAREGDLVCHGSDGMVYCDTYVQGRVRVPMEKVGRTAWVLMVVEVCC